MTSFIINDEWDVMEVVSIVDNKYHNNAFEELRPYIKFTMTLRRKTLFYTVNMIIPCVSMSLLTVIVFGLPSDSGIMGEK
jgi:nicotinic acetylcholine receptor